MKARNQIFFGIVVVILSIFALSTVAAAQSYLPYYNEYTRWFFQNYFVVIGSNYNLRENTIGYEFEDDAFFFTIESEIKAGHTVIFAFPESVHWEILEKYLNEWQPVNLPYEDMLEESHSILQNHKDDERIRFIIIFLEPVQQTPLALLKREGPYKEIVFKPVESNNLLLIAADSLELLEKKVKLGKQRDIIIKTTTIKVGFSFKRTFELWKLDSLTETMTLFINITELSEEGALTISYDMDSFLDKYLWLQPDVTQIFKELNIDKGLFDYLLE